MQVSELAGATSEQKIAELLDGTIDLLEMVFPERLRACYLHGSFLDGSGIETSDIDLFLVVRGSFSPEEHAKLQRVSQACARLSPLMVEMMVLDETQLLQHGHYRVKCASRLIRGEDLRAQMPEQDLDTYLRLYAHFPFIYLSQMLRHTDTLTAPLMYPQESGEFYGYDQSLLPPRNDPRQNVKKLVTGVCWAATVFLAWQTGRTVPGKRASVELYREHIHDAWSPLIEELYTLGNQRWRYLVPQEQAARLRLRELCAQTLAFEQHYLHAYRDYLLQERAKPGPGQSIAERQLSKLNV